MFSRNQFILKISTQDNKIGNEGIKAIAKGIKYNTSIQELDLSGKGINPMTILSLIRYLNR